MRPKSHLPFTLFKHKSTNGLIWYARFWNESEERYSVARSTNVLVEGKRERRAEAERAAREMLGSIKFSKGVSDTLFIDFLLDFWRMDSKYAKEHVLRYGKPLSGGYVKIARESVQKYIAPYNALATIPVQNVTTAMIRDWMLWASEQGLSGKRINTVFESMRAAIRWAYEREDLDSNPCARGKKAHHVVKERGILTPKEVTNVIQLEADDPFRTVAVMLGCLCGMRLGEVRGLQWGDIDFEKGIIDIRHNYTVYDGLKEPKAGSFRKVPIVDSLSEALQSVKKNYAHWYDASDFVFARVGNRMEPRDSHYFERSLSITLRAIGIPTAEQKERNIVFHSLRHCFVTLGRMSGLSDLVIMNLAGHKTPEMMARYSHAGQVIDFADAKMKLEAMKKEKGA